jgi:hypothetical protein
MEAPVNLVVLIGASAVVLFVVSQVVRRFQQRLSISDQEIWEFFSREKKYNRENVLFLWHEIAQTMKTSSGLIRPDDTLRSLEPSGSGILTPYLDLLIGQAVRHAKSVEQPIDFEKILTVRDYIAAFHEAVEPTPKTD